MYMNKNIVNCNFFKIMQDCIEQKSMKKVTKKNMFMANIVQKGH
jgi:hypothetical protein